MNKRDLNSITIYIHQETCLFGKVYYFLLDGLLSIALIQTFAIRYTFERKMIIVGNFISDSNTEESFKHVLLNSMYG